MNTTKALKALNNLNPKELQVVMELAVHAMEKDWGVDYAREIITDEEQDALHEKLHEVLYPE